MSYTKNVIDYLGITHYEAIDELDIIEVIRNYLSRKITSFDIVAEKIKQRR